MGKAARLKRERRPEWAKVLDRRALALDGLRGMYESNAWARAQGFGIALPDGEYQADIEALLSAEMFYVSPKIFNLMKATRGSFKEEPMLRTDLLCDRGFALFPERIKLPHTYGGLGLIAVRWSFVDVKTDGEKTLEIQFFTDQPHVPLSGLFPVCHVYYDILDRQHCVLKATDDGAPIPISEEEAFKYIWPLQMLFRIAQQKIAVDQTEELQPQQQRKVRDREDSRVRVITLRRTEARRETGDGSHASPRGHVVPAHWKQQWYPSMKAHRNLYIDDYFRGDPDDLMPSRATVYNVSR